MVSLGEPCTGTVQRLWTGAGSDSLYSNPQNWQGEEPALGDNIIARYATDDIYVVHVDPASLYVEGYSVGAGDITFDLQGATSQLAPGNTYCLQHSMDVASGADESAVIRVEGGSMHTAASVLLGDGAASDTGLHVGPGATFRAGETDSIYTLHAARGENAQSAITVAQNGALEASNLMLAEGSGSTTALTMNVGAQVKAGETVLAGGAGSTSTVLVEDTTAARGGATGDTRFASDVLIIGKQGAGAMTVRGQNALLETFAATLGVSTGASGMLTVDNSNWNHIGSAPVEIGRDGAGTLLMQNGSRWNHTGEGSIVVGVSAASQATIESGSKVTISATSPQPNLSISHGAVYVTGMNSSIDAPASVLSVGGPGASLAISAGATVTFAFGQLGGGSSDSTVSVTGAGSALSFVALGDLAGRQGLIINRGPLTVSAGAHLQSTLTAVASEAGNSASVTITGSGTSWTNAGHLFVGWGPDPILPNAGGVGSVVIEQGAVLQTGGLCVGGSGTVTGVSINCGIAPPLRGEAGGIYTQELFIAPGTVLDTPAVTFHPGAVLGGTGAWPATFTNDGAVVAGEDGSLGNFTFGADYAQTLAGALHIDLKSREDIKSYPYWFHESDQLLIAGAATLGGTLALSIHPGSETDWAFSQGVTPTYTILTAASVTGEFAQVTLSGCPSCRAEVEYTATSAVVTLAPRCPGDANDDLAVNFDDITAVIANWSAAYTPDSGPGDANTDTLVDFEDINAVLANWGVACP